MLISVQNRIVPVQYLPEHFIRLTIYIRVKLPRKRIELILKPAIIFLASSSSWIPNFPLSGSSIFIISISTSFISKLNTV